VSVRDAIRVIVRAGAGEAHAIDVPAPPRGIIRVGHGTGLDVRLPDDAVAAEHLRLERDGAGWRIVACAAGVEVGGTTLAAGASAPLALGQPISVVGRFVLELAVATGVPGGPDHTASLARELVRDLLGTTAVGLVELVVETGPAAGKRVSLPPPESRIVIGRGEQCDVNLVDDDLSRAHVAVDRTWQGTRVVDLGSKNRTQVDGALAPVEPAPGVEIHDGAVILLGRCRIKYLDPAERYLRELDNRLGQLSGPHRMGTAPVAAAAPVAAPPPRPRSSLAPVAIAVVIAIAAVAAIAWLLA
jgi:pSer/pThr/pTyr-binding forkhead associated (FHA) protein